MLGFVINAWLILSSYFFLSRSEPIDVIHEAPKFMQHIVCDYHGEYGMSGGPVILDAEKVVGINYQMNMSTSFAITAATVKSVLKLWLGRGDNVCTQGICVILLLISVSKSNISVFACVRIQM